MNSLLRPVAVMLAGNFLIGFGTALFKVSSMGTGSCVAMILALSRRFGFEYQLVFIVCCAFFLILEFVFGRRFIGAGTLVNWLGVGTVSGFFIDLIERSGIVPDDLAVHLILMSAGVLTLSLGCSMYQTSNLGISPYDSMSLIISSYGHYKYFWCRIFTDSVCVSTALFFGGEVGIGTLICALGMGPFVSFFDVRVSRKLCGFNAA